MGRSTAADSPIDPGTMRAVMELPTGDLQPTIVKKYQELMGCLIWLLIMKTRNIDMGFTVNCYSRFMQVATEAHYTALRDRLLRYLRGTTNHGIIFKAGTANCRS